MVSKAKSFKKTDQISVVSVKLYELKIPEDLKAIDIYNSKLLIF